MKQRVSFTGLLTAAGILACLATLVGFAGRFWWGFELAAHFRVQYALALSGFALILLVLRPWRGAALFGAFALLNLTLVVPARWTLTARSFTTTNAPRRFTTCWKGRAWCCSTASRTKSAKVRSSTSRPVSSTAHGHMRVLVLGIPDIADNDYFDRPGRVTRRSLKDVSARGSSPDGRVLPRSSSPGSRGESHTTSTSASSTPAIPSSACCTPARCSRASDSPAWSAS